MNKYIISTDSACDLPQSYVVENNITIISLYYAIDEGYGILHLGLSSRLSITYNTAAVVGQLLTE